jgi:hypothetical protein
MGEGHGPKGASRGRRSATHTKGREEGGGAMTVFLFMTASVALLAGLVGLVAGHVH